MAISRRGGGVTPPAGATYSPWTMTRDQQGIVYFAAGAWRDAKGQTLEDPPALAVAGTSSGPVVDPEGVLEITTNNLPPNRAVKRPQEGTKAEP